MLITSSAVDTALLYVMSAGLNALNATSHQVSQPTISIAPLTRNDVQAPIYTTMPLVTNSVGHSARPHPTVNQPPQETTTAPQPIAGSSLSSINDSIEQAVLKRFAKMEALI